MPKPVPGGPSNPPEAEDPGLEALKQSALDTYARQAAQAKADLAEQARSDKAIAELKAESAKAGGLVEPSAAIRPVAPAAAPLPVSTNRQVVVPRPTGQKLPSKSTKGGKA